MLSLGIMRADVLSCVHMQSKEFLTDEDGVKCPTIWFTFTHPNFGYNPAKDSQAKLQMSIQVRVHSTIKLVHDLLAHTEGADGWGGPGHIEGIVNTGVHAFA
jgi:hypothetical protein